jgi:hypothetical protein
VNSSLAIAVAAISTRIAYHGGRTVEFSAHGSTVRIAVRAAS